MKLLKITGKVEILGIDLGNTIIKKREPIPDAFRVIRRLREERFGDKIFIVSRVNEEQEGRARVFVQSDPFAESTGITMDRVHFCRERHEKGPICRRLGLTHFIDDRPEVMASCASVPFRILFNPEEGDIEKYKELISGMLRVKDWIEVEELLL